MNLNIDAIKRYIKQCFSDKEIAKMKASAEQEAKALAKRLQTLKEKIKKNL